MNGLDRDKTLIHDSLQYLRNAIHQCNHDNYVFAQHISTEVFKLLFDRNKYNNFVPLVERVVGSQAVFHPLRRKLPGRTENLNGLKWLLSDGDISFRSGKIYYDLFDLMQAPIGVEAWGNQVLLITTVDQKDLVHLSIIDFVKSLRNQDHAHADPVESLELKASKSVLMVESGRKLKFEKMVIAIGEYVANQIESLVFPSPNGFSRWGFDLVREHNFLEAIAMFRSALALQSDYTMALGGWGFALLHLGEYEQAAEKFREALAVNPGFAEALNHLGIALGFLSKDEEALSEFTKATSYKANYGDAWHNWGVALYRLGRINEAAEKFRNALKCPGERPESLVALNRCLSDLKAI